jgi:hypothetical protein
MGELSQALLIHLFDFIVCVTVIACTMFVFEGLGDIQNFQDRFVSSGMGDISFFQLCYFAMTTMTTVGYGDFSPTTVFNRFFFFVASVGGVTFFSMVTSELLDLTGKLNSGLGKYRPKYAKGHPRNLRGHILVMGGGVTSSSKTCLEIFLRGLCREKSIPEIVLLAEECSEDVSGLLASKFAKRFNIKYFRGHATKPEDLSRVKAEDASMTFIIPDFFSDDTFNEDYNNVLLTAALQAYTPDAQYRLMTIEVRHLDLCVDVGLNIFNCYALDGLKAATLATALRCPGLPTLVMNLGLPDIEEPLPFELEVSPWMKE